MLQEIPRPYRHSVAFRDCVLPGLANRRELLFFWLRACAARRTRPFLFSPERNLAGFSV